jgi:hypothetical protein
VGKNYWLRYLAGVKKERMYTKSGGNFVVKRYLQNKSTFYSRFNNCEGEQQLDAKM